MSILFRKRSALVRRLLRHRISDYETPETLERFSLEQLESMLQSVESHGAEDAPCVHVPDCDYLLFIRIFRWPEVVQEELKKLCCQHSCCNPYHWSRLYKPELPSLSSYCIPVGKTHESITSEYVSQYTDCSEASRPWCKVAYWELGDRVGRLLPVCQSSLHVFGDLPKGDGLCLKTLADGCPTDVTQVLNARKKIAAGINVFRESNQVWVYNRSDYPIFCNSPTLDQPNTSKLTVFKVPPGYSINIFDYERAAYNHKVKDLSLLKDGPLDPYAVRISFGKGWGPGYSRRFVTSCPCWVEIMFLDNR